MGSIEPDRLVAVQPCYWKALELQGQPSSHEMIVQINDEYEAPPTNDVRDFRVRLYGEILGALPKIAMGRHHSSAFEEWVFRVLKILFASQLANPQLKPNPVGVRTTRYRSHKFSEVGILATRLSRLRKPTGSIRGQNYEGIGER